MWHGCVQPQALVIKLFIQSHCSTFTCPCAVDTMAARIPAMRWMPNNMDESILES